ncbi:129_t:CDS:2 [Cetraspora pellucida]|uniref:129_t:CDS:1 n=1 Tax=Cetraspora pellucida TaxID=1433469 RepID=A0ACA9KAN5_9GLOM|nr:129_t:CDS:2 [Cetraspora pellucida]
MHLKVLKNLNKTENLVETYYADYKIDNNYQNRIGSDENKHKAFDQKTETLPNTESFSLMQREPIKL